ncbi:hypothetical protein N7492_009970 [Penicillium capsulatum]|uniref:Uncharacterized protein n=1 Tax=Penicillium capsulatum TaxID=69766 RepID=A0A9W9HN43_9EURO|nr:hypothetical protein N7492_009970 [Penicillium capsulatum]KAJ6112480.1 hypothetical protein N7512_007804 [Penicillium capsulatum]
MKCSHHSLSPVQLDSRILFIPGSYPPEPESSPKSTMSPPQLPPRNPNRDKRYNSVATSHEELITALHLVADSVAQQRQPAARSIIFHPIYWAVMLALLSYLYHTLYTTLSDYTTILLIWCGLLMASLTFIKYLVRGYLDAAEQTGRWTWLYGEASEPTTTHVAKKPRQKKNSRARTRNPGHRDIVLISWFRGKIIAVVILRVVRIDRRNAEPRTNASESSTPTTSASDSSPVSTPSALSRPVPGQSRRCKAYIRAWTVQQRYRGYGMGREILNFAIRLCYKNGFGDPVFADDHAHSVRILPRLFNWWIQDMEERARDCLEREILAIRG